MAENDCTDFNAFHTIAKSNESVRVKIIDAMTTNETLWFRDESPFIALREKIFPEMDQKLKAGQKSQIKIWSAACSTGQEPYSIVMTAKEFERAGHPGFSDRISIMATDISTSALFLAKNGRYDDLSMSRGMLPGYQEKFFDKQGRISIIKDEVRKPITFQSFNLQQPFSSLGTFDIIFLRNVAIYFSLEFKMELFKKLAAALNPGGYLIIGASESLIGIPHSFKTLEHGRCIYYQV